MAAPTLLLAADRLYEQVQHLELDGEQNGYPLAALCAAMMAPLEPIYELVAGTENPYEILMDIDRCPVALLPWAAMLNGVSRSAIQGLEADRQRDVIRDAAGRRRGTVGGVIAAAQKYLTGNRTVILVERVTKPTDYVVITRTAETPDADAVMRALTAGKPGRLQFTHIISDLELWLDVDPAVTWTTIDSAITWDDMSGSETIHA